MHSLRIFTIIYPSIFPLETQNNNGQQYPLLNEKVAQTSARAILPRLRSLTLSCTFHA